MRGVVFFEARLRKIGALTLAFVAFAAAPVVIAEPGESPHSLEIINKYLAAAEEQKARTAGMTMETEIEAKLPTLKKEGHLHALRHISRIGRITYNALRFTGDNVVKKEVIARFLTAESEAMTNARTMAINHDNYKFKYKGIAQKEGRPVHVIEVKPHKKAVGLFNGEIWADTETFCALRESGTLVKQPSVFLKKVAFVRRYTVEGGMALLHHVDTVIDTRIVGRAELRVTYSDYRRVDDDQSATPSGSEDQ